MLPTINWQDKPYPIKSILMLNEDVYTALVSVIKDLTSEQLNFSQTDVHNRTINQMIDHLLDSQYRFFTKELIFGEKEPEPNFSPTASIAEVQQRITDYYQKIVDLYTKINPSAFSRKIATPWGQELTVELVAFQGVTHAYYHVSEICFLCGIGGFYNKALG